MYTYLIIFMNIHYTLYIILYYITYVCYIIGYFVIRLYFKMFQLTTYVIQFSYEINVI